jgi:hypothetical protein
MIAGVSGQTGARLGAGLILGGLLLSVSVIACTGESVRDADVVLSDVRSATVVSSDGSSHQARDGERLRRDDRVRTDPGGAATLTVRSRRVLLGKDTEVTVPDGARLTLARGTLLVDRRRGPALTVDAGQSTVDRIEPGAVRIGRSYAVELAVYSGRARIRSTSGRSLAVPALYQTAAPGRSLATRPSPLALTPGDPWETLVIPAIVVMDEKLTQLARGIDTSWTRPAGTVVPAVFAGVDTSRPASESVLPKAIGEAAARRGLRADPSGQAVRLRAAGASWGVVAALLDTDLTGVSRALSDLIRGEAPTPIPETPGDGGFVTPTPEPGQTPRPGGTATPKPTRSPGEPEPSESESPTPGPTSSIDQVVKELEELVPTPTPSGFGLLRWLL